MGKNRMCLRIAWVAVCMAILVGTLASGLGCSREEPEFATKEAKPRAAAVKEPGARACHHPNKLEQKSGRAFCVTDADERTDLAPADRETLKKVQQAMEDENIGMLRTAARAALQSQTDEVRSDTVDALGWFGVRAMDDLLPFMVDANADIAQSALDNWTTALGEIEDGKRRCTLIEGVMRVLTDKDALESLVVEFNESETFDVIQSLVNLIGSGNRASAEVAREHYEFLTGEEYTTVEAANAWVSENCTEDEED